MRSQPAQLAVIEIGELERLELAISVLLQDKQVEDPDVRLPGEKVVALWRAAYARAGDPDLSLHAVEALPFGAYTVIDFLCRTSATIGGGIERISRYFPLINSVVELPIEQASDEVTMGVVDPRDPAGLPRAAPGCTSPP